MKKEAEVQKEVRYRSAQDGILLWRNNVGAATDQSGNFFRYGLANDTPQMAKNCKSSDLVGIRPVVITPDMVGQTIGQFVAIECKREGWKYSGSDRERAQLTFLRLVQAKGGCALFAESPVRWDSVHLFGQFDEISTRE